MKERHHVTPLSLTLVNPVVSVRPQQPTASHGQQRSSLTRLTLLTTGQIELLEPTQSPLETLGLRPEFSPCAGLRLALFLVYYECSVPLSIQVPGVALGGLTRLSPALSYQLWEQEPASSIPLWLNKLLPVVFHEKRYCDQTELSVARVPGLQEKLPKSFNEEIGQGANETARDVLSREISAAYLW